MPLSAGERKRVRVTTSSHGARKRNDLRAASVGPGTVPGTEPGTAPGTVPGTMRAP
jgi:hypothetical protein